MNAQMVPIEEGYRGALTDKQALFVRHYIQVGGNASKAAELAGYAQPLSRGTELTKLPHVAAAIRAGTERMVMEGATKAVGWMVDALDDKKLPGAVRFQCARWLAEAGGHGLAPARAALGLDADQRPDSELTLAELDARIRAGERALEVMREASRNAESIPGQLVVPDKVRSVDAEDAQVVDPPQEG